MMPNWSQKDFQNYPKTIPKLCSNVHPKWFSKSYISFIWVPKCPQNGFKMTPQMVFKILPKWSSKLLPKRSSKLFQNNPQNDPKMVFKMVPNRARTKIRNLPQTNLGARFTLKKFALLAARFLNHKFLIAPVGCT